MAGYDQVALKMPGGGFNMITRMEFEAKPVNERIKLILDGKVQFMRDGLVIPPGEALKGMGSLPGNHPPKKT